MWTGAVSQMTSVRIGGRNRLRLYVTVECEIDTDTSCADILDDQDVADAAAEALRRRWDMAVVDWRDADDTTRWKDE